MFEDIEGDIAQVVFQTAFSGLVVEQLGQPQVCTPHRTAHQILTVKLVDEAAFDVVLGSVCVFYIFGC